MRTIGVVTTSRADWGIYRPLLKAFRRDPGLKLRLIVSGTHLAPEYGFTLGQILDEGWLVDERVEMMLASDSPEGAAKSLGLGVLGFAQALAKMKPDILVVLGDRFEMLAAAVAALPLNQPLAHIHGGELTLGAIDDSARHAITKLSHLHFVSTRDYARRVIQMGEEPWRATVCGALSLDNLAEVAMLERSALGRALGLDLGSAPLLVTYHPVTRDPGRAPAQMAELLAALEQAGRQTVFTLPNADPGGRELADMVHAFVEAHPWAAIRDNLGTQKYFSLMKHAAAMVGNSSSGLIEAPSLGLPVVNVGTRQEGRVRGANVIDVGYGRAEIAAGIARALAPEFRQGLADAPNPYGDGQAAERIVTVLKQAPLGPTLTTKRFADQPPPEDAS